MDDIDTMEPIEAAEVRPPAAARLVAPGQSPGDVVQALLGAIQRREVNQKLGRELLIRLVPPSKATIRLRLPVVRDAASYATASQAVMSAAAAGKIAPSDAVLMQRGLKAAWDATRAAARERYRLA